MWPSRGQIGGLEQLVLCAVLRLGDHAYGVRIVDELRAVKRGPVSRPAVYLSLARLERRGLLTATLGDPSPTRGGRAKRYYHVTREGLTVLRAVRRMYLALWQGLDVELDGA
jgi:PadR family transcriptional regulator, regulatory protein PadR